MKFNYSRDDLIGDITTPLQMNSAHRASDMAGVHCYFGLFFFYIIETISITYQHDPD